MSADDTSADTRADDPTPREVSTWRRALDALPPAERAMVARMAHAVRAALAQPRTRRRPALVCSAEPGENDAGDAPPDEVAAAHARRILERHRRTDGAA